MYKSNSVFGVDYPIVAVISKRGKGKSLYLTKIAKEAHNAGLHVFANYTLHGIPYSKVTYADILNMPTWLKNGVLLLDEISVGADSGESWKASNKAVQTFAAQSRKRHISIFYAGQLFQQVTKRLRELTDFYTQVSPADDNPDYVIYQIWESEYPNELIYTNAFNGTEVYNNYDTDEIITFDGSAPVDVDDEPDEADEETKE